MSADADVALIVLRPKTGSGHRARARVPVPTAGRWPDTVEWCHAPVSGCRARSGPHARPRAPASALQPAYAAAATPRRLQVHQALLKALLAALKRDAARALCADVGDRLSR